jgi:hypothetical protein
MRELIIRGAADWENGGKYFSISLPPTDKFKEILEIIQEWERQKILVIDEGDMIDFK